MQNQIIKVPENKAGIPFPHMTYVKISQLTIENINRDIIDSHVNTMMTTIREDGFMDVIKVFPSHKNNKDGLPLYKIAESQHRKGAVKNIMKNSGEDGYVPIAILYWKDPNDIDEIYGAITTLNHIGKRWEIYQYVSSNAKMTHWKNNKLHVEIRDNMKSLLRGRAKLMTNACVAQLYTFKIRGQKPLKDRKLAVNFGLSPIRLLIKDTLLSELPKMIGSIGFDRCGCSFQKRFIHQLQISPLSKTNIQEWFRFVDHCIQMTKLHVATAALPDGDETFKEWFDIVKREFKQD